MKKACIFFLFASLSGAVLAGADCQKYPESERMSVFDFQKKIVNDYGFAIMKFKVEDECYEIYGWEMNADGKKQKIEVYFDAKTGEIVKKKQD